MKILLAGANGFVGQHLEQALIEAGQEVIGCGRGRRHRNNRAWIDADFSTDRAVADWLPRVTDDLAAGIRRHHIPCQRTDIEEMSCKPLIPSWLT